MNNMQKTHFESLVKLSMSDLNKTSEEKTTIAKKAKEYILSLSLRNEITDIKQQIKWLRDYEIMFGFFLFFSSLIFFLSFSTSYFSEEMTYRTGILTILFVISLAILFKINKVLKNKIFTLTKLFFNNNFTTLSMAELYHVNNSHMDIDWNDCNFWHQMNLKEFMVLAEKLSAKNNSQVV